MSKGDQIAPLLASAAGFHRSHGALAGQRPDALEDRFQSNAVLVGRPQFDVCLRKRGRHRPRQRADFFLNVC